MELIASHLSGRKIFLIGQLPCQRQVIGMGCPPQQDVADWLFCVGVHRFLLTGVLFLLARSHGDDRRSLSNTPE